MSIKLKNPLKNSSDFSVRELHLILMIILALVLFLFWFPLAELMR